MLPFARHLVGNLKHLEWSFFFLVDFVSSVSDPLDGLVGPELHENLSKSINEHKQVKPTRAANV